MTTPKICVIGPHSSGKTRFVHEFLLSEDPQVYQYPTVGLEVRPFTIGGIDATIWDFAGKEAFTSSHGYVGASLFIIVLHEFDQLDEWTQKINGVDFFPVLYRSGQIVDRDGSDALPSLVKKIQSIN